MNLQWQCNLTILVKICGWDLKTRIEQRLVTTRPRTRYESVWTSPCHRTVPRRTLKRRLFSCFTCWVSPVGQGSSPWVRPLRSPCPETFCLLELPHEDMVPPNFQSFTVSSLWDTTGGSSRWLVIGDRLNRECCFIPNSPRSMSPGLSSLEPLGLPVSVKR